MLKLRTRIQKEIRATVKIKRPPAIFYMNKYLLLTVSTGGTTL